MCRRAILLAPTDGTASGHEGCKKPKGIPINESALRDVEAAAIGQQVLVFEAATGRGIDEAFDRRLGGTLREGRISFHRGYWDKLSFLKMHGLPLE